MADSFTDKLEGFASTIGQKRRILLNAKTGDITAGGNGAGGDLRVVNDQGHLKIRLDATGTEPGVGAEVIQVPISIRGNGTLSAGSAGVTGKISLLDGEARELVTLSAASTDLVLRTPAGRTAVSLRASEGEAAGLWLGGNERGGWIVLRDKQNKDKAHLDGEQGRLSLFTEAGVRTAALYSEEEFRTGLWMGGGDRSGFVVLRNGAGTNRAVLEGHDGQLTLHLGNGNATVRLQSSDGDLAGLWCGTNGRHGFVLCRNASGTTRIAADAQDGEVRVYDEKGDSTIVLNGAAGRGRFGGRGVHGDVQVYSASVDDRTSDNAAIWLQGNTGDIILRNADCAEEFEVRDDGEVEPGSVLSLQPDGRLAVSNRPYDTCVAGIVSGADGVRPGIVLGRVPGAKHRWPVGLAGKVMCNVDTSFGPIEVGTLLTTSPRAGYAMAATDRERAFGAVIGKAMAPLASGSGRVPVLVALQ